MDVELSFKQELYKNLENLLTHLESLKINSNTLIDFDLVTKIHSLKHQLSYLHYANFAKAIYELEKFIIRVIRNNILISSTQVGLISELIDYIYSQLYGKKIDNNGQTLDFYINKLKELNSINELAYKKSDNIFTNTNFNQTLKKDTIVNLSCSLNDVNTFLNSLDEMQNYVYLNEKLNSEKLRNIVNELTNNFRKIRNEPLRNFATKINYIVNAIASDCGKVVKCSIEAKDCFIDQILIELLFDPITQIIKNNIIHGIESIEERKLKNKTAFGNLFISFYTKDDLLNIEIVNDGQPINIKELRKKIQSDDNISDEAVANFIFSPFVTTKEHTEMDGGSGIGLAGVKMRIEQLGGKISVMSNEQLTLFKLVVPRNFIYTEYNVFKTNRIYFAIPSNLAKDIEDNNSIFNMKIFDVRYNKNNCCNVNNQCFSINVNNEDVFIISDGVLKHFFLYTMKRSIKNDVLIGIGCLNNNDIVLQLNEKVTSTKGREFWDRVNECNLLFLSQSGRVKKIPICNIKRLKYERLSDIKNFSDDSKFGNIKVSFINNGKSQVARFCEIIDIEL